ncbi:MAG: hypothetical protein ACOC7U_00640 [Spirochaetota bacterium]
MTTNKSRAFLAVLNLIGYIGMVAVNGLANTLPINNKTTGELSVQYPNLFVPAGLTFSIWGLIYVLLAVFVIYQLVCVFNKTDSRAGFMDRIGGLFFVSSVANLGWIFAWHYEVVGGSVIVMLVLLASLVGIYLRLGIGRSGASRTEKYLVHLPFSIYLGWITIATIANITAFLVHIGWNRLGLSEQFWTVLVIIVGIALALIALFYRRDIFYALVVDWALIGILIKRMSVDIVPIQSILAAVIAGISILTLGMAAQIVRGRVYR